MHQRPGGPIALVLYVVAIVGELYNLIYFYFCLNLNVSLFFKQNS